MGAAGRDNTFGFGLVRANEALEYLDETPCANNRRCPPEEPPIPPVPPVPPGPVPGGGATTETETEVDLNNEAQNINDIDIIFPGGGGSDLRSEARPNVITNEVISNIRIDVPKPPKPDKPQIKTVFKKAPKPRTPPTKIKKMPKSTPRSRVKRRDKPPKTIVVEPRIVEKVDSCMRYERKIEQLLDQKIVMQEKIQDLKDEVILLRRRNQLKANRVNSKGKANFFD